jgi:DsbC/DsbD-like thiol-disulfide interchange protein
MFKLLMLAVVLAFPCGLLAQKVTAELLVDHTAIRPGQSFKAGVLLHIDPGYHIYWKYPGDAGLPTRVMWNLPPGFAASELNWPVPRRFDQPGGIEGIGYEEQVMLLADITPPPGFTGTAQISADVRWLVCRETCTPGKATRTATISTAESDTPSNQELFTRWLDRVPRPAVDVQIQRQDHQYSITAASAVAEVFLAPPSGFSSEKPRISDNLVHFTLAPLTGAGTPNQATGEVVLVFKDPSRRPIRISLPR